MLRTPHTTHVKDVGGGRSSVLRPYQGAVIKRVRELYESGVRRLLVPLATGLGKTVVFTHLPQAFPSLSKRGTLILVHRDELVTQAVSSVRRFLPNLTVGVEKGQEIAGPSFNVVVASVQTLGRRVSGKRRLQKYHQSYGGIIVVDEAHHLKAGGMYDTILDHFQVGSRTGGDTGGGRLLTGFTATPNRADGLSLRPFFDRSVGGLDLAWGIGNGYLVDIHAFAVRTTTDINQVPVHSQDFSSRGLSLAVNNDVRNAATAQALLRYGAGALDSPEAGALDSPGAGALGVAGEGTQGGSRGMSRSIAFCADVQHAHDLARTLTEHGMSSLAIDGSMGKEERHSILEAFRSGEISTVTNCGVLTEGFDAPYCNTVVMCRPTKSAPLYMQMLGRGTRPLAVAPDTEEPGGGDRVVARREAILRSAKPRMHVIDMVDNCGRHKVVSMAAALGLGPDFTPPERGASVERLASLVTEARRHDPSAPLHLVSSPRDLALMVRRYRLLEGAKSGTVTTSTGMSSREEEKSADTSDREGALHLERLSAGDRVGHDARLKVIIEDIKLARNRDGDHRDGGGGRRQQQHRDVDAQPAWSDEQEDNDSSSSNNSNNGVQSNPGVRPSSPSCTSQSQGRGAEDNTQAYHHPATPPVRHQQHGTTCFEVRGTTQPRLGPGAAEVFMRDVGGNLLLWRTSRVRDAEGEELHEGCAYSVLGATVVSVDAAAGKVTVSRCRLSPADEALVGG